MNQDRTRQDGSEPAEKKGPEREPGRRKRFETRAVHSGEKRSAGGGAGTNGASGEAGGVGAFFPISTPIYASTTFSHPDVQTTDRVLGGEEEGFSYARYDNPTVVALERAIADLEDPEGVSGGRAFAFASGMAAMHAALSSAELGDGATVLAAEQLYGSTATLLLQIFAPAGVEVRFVDAFDPEAVEAKVEELSPRALVVESISNPLLRVADIPRLAETTKKFGTALIVDSTFATPLLQRPLELGADIVVHSATKYLSGHGDLTAGIVAAGPPYDGAVEQVRKLVGGILGPFEAWLAHRGLKTLPLRVRRQCENARAVASRLCGHPKVEKVNHPSLPHHPDTEVTPRVLGGAGGLLSFELGMNGSEDPSVARKKAFEFLNALELCVRAPSLGDVYTLAIHPATSSHREFSPSRRERLGVGENLVRLSCGIEHPDDIAEDIERALSGL